MSNKYLEKIAVTLSKTMDVPQYLFDAAEADPLLAGFTKRQGKVIYHDGKEIGFMTPKKTGKYYRTGSIFITPEYRGKGLGAEAIKQYFADKPAAISYVEPHNISSRKAFEKAGLKIVKRVSIDGYDYDVLRK